jgi:hypothetical protein
VHLTSPRRMHGEQATLAKKAKNWDGCMRWAAQGEHGPNKLLRGSAQSFGRGVDYRDRRGLRSYRISSIL